MISLGFNCKNFRLVRLCHLNSCYFLLFPVNFTTKRQDNVRLSNMTSANLLEKIKNRLATMDLFNQMDKAKELTHFALTHQAISREEKE